jgi:anti-sigma regulatory factor (Ser/Thr protein kinase)
MTESIRLETPLLELWLQNLETIEVVDEASVSLARQTARECGARAALSPESIETVALAASELGHNQLRHALIGWMGIAPIERAGIAGVEIVAADRGPGIARPIEAVRGEGTSQGLGAGLPAVFRLMDEVDVDLRLSEGTCIRARKFATPPPHISEVAVMAAPYPGESINGDAALFARERDQLLLCVADGLGHGELARAASDRAIQVALEQSFQPVAQILRACDRTLLDTRGAAMAVAILARDDGRIRHACVGNVTTTLHRNLDRRRFTSTAGFLGSRSNHLRVAAEDVDWCAGDLLVMFTDGFRSEANLFESSLMVHQHPIFTAAYLFERFRRDHDDACVLVAR